MSRQSLAGIRAQLLVVLDDDDWTTPSEIADALGLGHGIDWLRVSLVLERLVNDGVADSGAEA